MTLATRIGRDRVVDRSANGLRARWLCGRVGAPAAGVARLRWGAVSLLPANRPGERAELGCGCSLIKYTGDLFSVMLERCSTHRVYQLNGDGE